MLHLICMISLTELLMKVLSLKSKNYLLRELITGLARMDGKPIGIIANQPRVKGGVLFHDSADKAAKFINLM